MKTLLLAISEAGATAGVGAATLVGPRPTSTAPGKPAAKRDSSAASCADGAQEAGEGRRVKGQ